MLIFLDIMALFDIYRLKCYTIFCVTISLSI